MAANRQTKVWFLVVLIVISVLVLLPSVVGKKLAPGKFTETAAGQKEGMLPHWWPAGRIKLGLDLRGGTYLVLGVQSVEAVKSQLTQIGQSVRSELRKKAGVRRVRQVEERDLEFILSSDKGATDLENFMKENYPNLSKVSSSAEGDQFVVRYSLDSARADVLRQDAIEQAIETVRNRIDAYGVSEPIIQRSGSEGIVVQLPDITDIKAVKETIGSVAQLEFRLVYEDGKSSGRPVERKDREGESINLEEDVLMTGDAIQKANVGINPETNEVEVMFTLNSLGAKTFSRVTKDNINRRLAIVLDNVVQSSPNIKSHIGGGSGVITGSFTKEEAKRLSIVLRSGALPAPLVFQEERTVGATLGSDSIKSGLMSMIIGSLCVFVFTIIYYRKAGVLAVGTLVLNMLFLTALLALFGATLTLPGIAGLALTVGMAVDANVVIYERIREELRNGVSVSAASAAGFLKAHWTIIDANLTTMLTGLVLLAFGTGPIKGFAVTLCLGILTSMFCALYASRLGFEVFKLRDSNGKLSI